MIQPICVLGSPVLRKHAAEISKDYKKLQQLIDDLFSTLEKCEGLGLAAPQIGVSLRAFVVDTSNIEDQKLAPNDFKKVFINPKILEYSGAEWMYNEGCLSIPGIQEEVSRPDKIRIQYFDESFNFHDEYYNGMLARIMQHEYDHLEGKLFIDRIPLIRRKLLQSKLNNIPKGKFEAKYKVKIQK
jgi:peptide deformylase